MSTVPMAMAARSGEAQRARGKQLGLLDDKLAFYDALETNVSAVKCDETLPDDRDRLARDTWKPA